MSILNIVLGYYQYNKSIFFQFIPRKEKLNMGKLPRIVKETAYI